MHKYLEPNRFVVMQRLQLKEPEEEILEELRHGDRTKGFLTDRTGRHRNTIYHSLQRLEAAGYVDCIHERTALYTLKIDNEDNE